MTSQSPASPDPGVDKALVHQLAESILEHDVLCHLGDHRLPDRESVDHLVELCRHLVFPDGAPYGGLLASILEALEVPTTELSARGHAPLVGL